MDPASFVDGGDGLATRSASDRGMNALAMTNPLYVDANGDGLWTPPGVQTHNGSALDGCPQASGTSAVSNATALPLILLYGPPGQAHPHPSPARVGVELPGEDAELPFGHLH